MEPELRRRLDKIDAILGDLVVLECMNILAANIAGTLEERADIISNCSVAAYYTLRHYRSGFDKRHGRLAERLEKAVQKRLGETLTE